jgi:hypothetical protein
MTKTKPHTSLSLACIGLSAVLLCGSATAAELPKEGPFTAMYSGFGTWKGTAIGKDRFLSAWDESGLTVATGFQDRMTWHCFG